MKRKKQIEHEVEETLRYLEPRESIEAGPFFSTRVQNRIRRLESGKDAADRKKHRHLILSPGLLGLLVVLNMLSLGFVLGTRNRTGAGEQEYPAALAEAYALKADDIIDHLK